MGEVTKIGWADHRFNPWIGYARVSESCWKQPAMWNRKAETDGIRRRVFCASLADVFDSYGPEAERERLWETIQVTPCLDWLLLTKQPKNIEAYTPENFGELSWPNVWIGITAENQANYEKRWPFLAKVSAAVRFISYEPAVGSLIPCGYTIADPNGDQTFYTPVTRTISLPIQASTIYPDWVVAGGGSGSGACPPEQRWFTEMRDHCASLGIPFWFKQWGDYRFHPLASVLPDLEGLKFIDPPENGEGGALIQGALHRALPVGAVL